MLGSLAPVLIAAASGEDPHHAAEESLAPVRPCLTTVLPLAIFRIEREIVRVIADQRLHLRLSELERLGGPLLERRCRIETRHRGPRSPAPTAPRLGRRCDSPRKSSAWPETRRSPPGVASFQPIPAVFRSLFPATQTWPNSRRCGYPRRALIRARHRTRSR